MDIEDEVKTKIRAIKVFVQVRERRFLSEHNTSVQTTPDPAAGGGVLPQRGGATTRLLLKRNVTKMLSIFHY